MTTEQGAPRTDDELWKELDARSENLVVRCLNLRGKADRLEHDLAAATKRIELLEKALRAMVTMSYRGPQPQKLDEALSWRANDELAHRLAREALAPKEQDNE